MCAALSMGNAMDFFLLNSVGLTQFEIESKYLVSVAVYVSLNCGIAALAVMVPV